MLNGVCGKFSRWRRQKRKETGPFTQGVAWIITKTPSGSLPEEKVCALMDGCIEDRGEDLWWVRDNNEELNRWLRYNRWIHVLRRWGVSYKSRLLLNEKKNQDMSAGAQGQNDNILSVPGMGNILIPEAHIDI